MEMVEICKTGIFDNITITTYYRFYGGEYQCFVEVHSDSPFQEDWSKRILTKATSLDGDDISFCFSIHSKVLKYIRKKLRRANFRLLRKARFRKLFLAQKGKCYLCSEPLTAFDCTIDHVFPKSKGGPKEKTNLLLAHRHCNHEKGSRMPTKEETAYLDRINELMEKMRDESVMV